MEKCLGFYKDAFDDFKLIRTWVEDGMKVAVFEICKGCSIEVFERGNEKPAENVKWHHIALCTSDVRAVYSHLIKKGAKEQIPPTDIIIPSDPPCPATFSFVTGPDGEKIEICSE
jgi:hypothetical protein